MMGPWSNEYLFEYADAILPEDERQGLLYAGGAVAKKMKKIDDSLGTLKDNFVPPNWLKTTCWFIDGMNRGGLLYPSEQFQRLLPKYRPHHQCLIESPP